MLYLEGILHFFFFIFGLMKKLFITRNFCKSAANLWNNYLINWIITKSEHYSFLTGNKKIAVDLFNFRSKLDYDSDNSDMKLRRYVLSAFINEPERKDVTNRNIYLKLTEKFRLQSVTNFYFVLHIINKNSFILIDMQLDSRIKQ